MHRSPIKKGYPVNLVQGGIGSVTSKLIDRIEPEVIFHCARPTLPRLKRPGRIIAAHLAQGYNARLLKELGRTKNRPSLVFASGSLVYGNGSQPHDETSPVNPLSYARQYIRGEKPMLEAIGKKSYPVAILRVPWLLGKGSWFSWFYLENLHRMGSLPLFGDGNNMMDIIDIRDVAKIMVNIASGLTRAGIYNVPGPGAVSQLSFVKAIEKVFDTGIKDYRAVFQGKLEREAIEAFTSNIILKTNYPEFTEGFNYRTISESLTDIRNSR
jgi:nucleoside-diphosphate-sugar epimerase